MSLALLIIRFVLLVAVQVLLLNNLYLWHLLNPLLYFYFIIKLPYQTPGWALLLWAFALGLTIDLFAGTPGMNAAATLLAAYAKPFIARMIPGRRDFDNTTTPTAREMGTGWYSLTLLITTLHHFTLYLIEDFGNGHWGILFLRTITNTLITVAFITLADYLFTRTKN